MNGQRDFLALGGPGHLQVIRLEAGQETFEMADATPDRNPVLSFVYRVVRVGAGSHPPIGFLIPSHLEGDQKHIAGWVFNKLVQGLMNQHPMAGLVLLGLNFVVSDRVGQHARVIRAEVRAHPVGANGIVRLAPLDTKDYNQMIDAMVLRDIKDLRGYLESVVRRTAEQAFRPFIDRAVAQVINNEKWKP